VYKDRERQRDAVKLATRRWRERVSQKVSPKVSQGITNPEGITVIPKTKEAVKERLGILSGQRAGKSVGLSHHPTCKCTRCVDAG
jgi:hypothetical protein